MGKRQGFLYCLLICAVLSTEADPFFINIDCCQCIKLRDTDSIDCYIIKPRQLSIVLCCICTENSWISLNRNCCKRFQEGGSLGDGRRVGATCPLTEDYTHFFSIYLKEICVYKMWFAISPYLPESYTHCSGRIEGR